MMDKGTDKYNHIPVLKEQFISNVAFNERGTYVDCTFGGGGHSRAMLSKLRKEGRLFAFDQDEVAQKFVIEDARFKLLRYNFKHINKILKLEGVEKVNGILADLGLSSFQLDEKERGFSFQHSAKIDMRMDDRLYENAWDVLNQLTAETLGKILKEYGEVSKSYVIAKTILENIKRTKPEEAVEMLTSVSKRFGGYKSQKLMAQIFQSLRIYVNDELNALQELMEKSIELLEVDGWMAVISFHSLEDRIVKRTFRNWEHISYQKISKQNDIKPLKRWQEITSKPIVPSDEEIKYNPRSSSAKLRIAKKMV